jgi:apolipoprotein N-acyltransferase
VPFGEYVPFRKVLPFIEKVAQGIGDFSFGKNEPNTLWTYDVPTFRPLICYEIIFPEISDTENAKWLLNISNDFWLGNSFGPHQHFAMAKFKAAEYGIPVVRVTNTGISGIINQNGIEEVKFPLNAAIAGDYKLPKVENVRKNYYINKIFLLISLLLIASAIYIKL